MRLDFIRPLYERQGPYASVYLAAIRGFPRPLREELAQADAATLDAVEREAVEPAPGRVVFATHGDVVLEEVLAEPPPRALAAWSPLPRVTPMLMWRGENVPHLRVIVDRAGVELTVYGGGSPRTAAVAPDPWPLHRTARGGWARRLYGHGPGQVWERDAESVAEEIDEQVRRIGAELVVVAGEPLSRSYLCDRLGTKAADRVLMVEHRGGDREGYARDAETALDGWIARRRDELLERHREHAGPTGLAQVAHALREGRVHAVLTPGELGQPVWAGKGGTQLSTDANELRDWGVEEPVCERADSAVARAAAMTDAELWFCPQLDDLGAVIRY